jgi:hypothetical protein
MTTFSLASIWTSFPKQKKLLFGILNEGFNKGLDFYQLFAQGSIYGLDSFACFLTLGYLGP